MIYFLPSSISNEPQIFTKYLSVLRMQLSTIQKKSAYHASSLFNPEFLSSRLVFHDSAIPFLAFARSVFGEHVNPSFSTVLCVYPLSTFLLFSYLHSPCPSCPFPDHRTRFLFHRWEEEPGSNHGSSYRCNCTHVNIVISLEGKQNALSKDISYEGH